MLDSTPFKRQEVRTFPLPPGIEVDREVPIEMDDGVRLAASLFLPAGGGPVPVLVAITPYGKDVPPSEYRVDFGEFAARGIYTGEFEISEATSFEGPDPAYWCPGGYAVLVVDARGYFASGGRPGVFTKRDTADCMGVIAWAAEQDWSSGKVALSGVSYLAIAQWYVAAERPPHLAAIVAWEGVSDPIRDAAIHGGIPETEFSAFWNSLMRRCSSRNGATLNPVAARVSAAAPSIVRRVVSPPQLERITVPALVCASWSDQGLHSRGSFNAFSRIGSSEKWLYTHGRKKWQTYYDSDALEAQRLFLDHFLKGGMGPLDMPRVRLEVRHHAREYEVRSEEAWPVPDTTYKTHHLTEVEDGVGRLDSLLPPLPGRVTYDARSGQAEFALAFEEETEITGMSSLRLWIEAEGARDMDLFVVILKRDKDGQIVWFEGHDGWEQSPASHGWLRASHRALDQERSRPFQPVPDLDRRRRLRSKQIAPVEIELLPQSTHFDPEESLVLVVAGHDIDRNPGIGHRKTVNAGRHVLHVGGPYDSQLTLPYVGTRGR